MSSHSLVTDTHIMIPRHVIDAHAQRSKYDKDTFVLLRRILTTSVNISIPLSGIVVQPSEHPHLTSAPRLFACPFTKSTPYSTDGLILVLTSPGKWMAPYGWQALPCFAARTVSLVPAEESGKLIFNAMPVQLLSTKKVVYQAHVCAFFTAASEALPVNPR